MRSSEVGLVVLASLMFHSACGDPRTGAAGVSTGAVISDEAHSGRRGFFFLPPLVAAPSATGTFDPLADPTVEVRELGTDKLVACFVRGQDSGSIRVEFAEEHYVVNWQVDESGLDPAQTYRISVLLAGEVLGFADIDVAGSGKELKDVNTDEYIPLLNGRTLPIKFRIEGGTLCKGDAASCVVRVPDDVATVQEAVDRVGDQGLVLLAPGTYNESVQITGKRVHLLGDRAGGAQSAVFVLPIAASEPTEPSAGSSDPTAGTPIIGPDLPPDLPPDGEQRGIIEFGSGGGGRLENLALVGGHAGILGHSDLAPLGDIAVTDVVMRSNGYGFSASFGAAKLTNVQILNSLWNGYQSCGGDQLLAHTLIENSAQMGFFAAKCGVITPSVLIQDTTIRFNQSGGVAIVGDVSFTVQRSTIQSNLAFGIFLANVSSPFIWDTFVGGTLEGCLVGSQATYCGLADGLIAASSSGITILGVAFAANFRTGLLLDASHATVSGVTSTGGQYGIVLNTGSTLTEVGSDNVFQGTVEDRLGDGALPVPEPPPAPQ